MKKFSGLVLDFYDDHDGSVLRSVFPVEQGVPGTIKEAHALSSVERDQLPDQAFALVLINRGEVLRKYACIDEGNTCLSVEYFLKNAHKLPVEAQKTAADNLVKACGWFDIEPPEELLEKTAIGALGLLLGATMAPGAIKETKRNLAATKGVGGLVMTPEQIKMRKMQMGLGGM